MTQIIKKWVKIILLNWEEEEIQEIQGRCTSGSVSIDGNAAVRRTCNLSMVVDNPQEINGDWAISKKIKVYIGIEENNSVNWYKQGIFVITSFSAAETANSYTVSLTAQDKMCLLNGTFGGALYAETDFGNISTYKTIKNPEGDETTVEEKIELSIFDIIKEAVHDFGKEKYENIIIKDIEDALELVEYRGSGVLLRNNSNGADNLIQIDLSDSNLKEKFKLIDYYGLFVLDGDGEYKPQYNFLSGRTYYIKVPQKTEYESTTKPSDKYIDLSELISTFSTEENYEITEEEFEDYLQSEYEYLQETYGVVYTVQNDSYNIAYDLPRTEVYILEAGNTIYQYGDVIGYRPTALTYSEKDFILKPGESVGALLEKIKNKFGLYEYFYDVDGKFVFQKKRTYINFQYNGTLNKNENSFGYLDNESEYIADYEDKKQIISINSSPQIQNIKNDYSIWGTTNDKIPFHVRIGVNKKPTEYVSYKGIKYSTLENVVEYEPVSMQQLSWLMTSSELYYKKDENTTYEPFTMEAILGELEVEIDESDNLFEALIWIFVLIIVIALTTQAAATGKFLYKKKEQKIDYRELIYQMALDYYSYHLEPDFYAVIEHNNPWAKNGKTGFESFYADMKEFWPHLYKGDLTKEDLNNYILAGENKGWSKKILEPSSLIFWFELIDGNEKYWIENIGSRLKAETNSEITAIAYKDTPNFLFTMTGKEGEDIPQGWKASNKNIGKFGSGYTNINVPVDLANEFVISSKHYSAMELAEQYIYSYTNLAETKSISIIPNYDLKPNYKIKLLGEPYAIKRITVPLAYNGVMNLELTKIYNN